MQSSNSRCIHYHNLNSYWLLLIWTSDPSAALKNLPPFTIIWLIIPLTFSHSMKPGCNPPILTISFLHWHPLAFPFWTLLVLLVMVVVLLSFINHSSKSNHSVLETFLLLSLLNSWQLNLLLAIKKLSFLISIVLHLLKSLPFLTNSKTFLNFLFLYLLNLSSLATSTFTLILTWQHLTNFLAYSWQLPSQTAHTFSYSWWRPHSWSSYNTYKFWHHHSSFTPWILSIWPQIFHF